MKKSDTIATELSQLMPTFLRHMYPYIFQPIALPPSQVVALVSIQEKGRCTLSELRKAMHVSAPTVTGIVDRLERDHYLVRIYDQMDRRVTYVRLTGKGAWIVKKFRINIKKRWQHILSHMPLETGDMVVRMVRQITKGFEDGSI